MPTIPWIIYNLKYEIYFIFIISILHPLGHSLPLGSPNEGLYLVFKLYVKMSTNLDFVPANYWYYLITLDLLLYFDNSNSPTTILYSLYIKNLLNPYYYLSLGYSLYLL